jgi:hypothetical protein
MEVIPNLKKIQNQKKVRNQSNYNKKYILINRDHHEYKQEDEMALNAFYLTVIFLTVFIILFIYNVIRCYTRSPPNEKPVDSRGYSRELQHHTTAVEDDAVLDLSAA